MVFCKNESESKKDVKTRSGKTNKSGKSKRKSSAAAAAEAPCNSGTQVKRSSSPERTRDDAKTDNSADPSSDSGRATKTTQSDSSSANQLSVRGS